MSEPILECGNDIGSTSVRGFIDKFAEISGNACFYSCAIATLYSSATQRYGNVSSLISSVGNNLLTLGKNMLLDPARWTGEGAEYLDGLLENLDNFIQATVTNAQNITTGQHDSFGQFMFNMLKTMAVRYSDAIVLAAIQKLVTEMQEDIGNRASVLGQINNKMGELQSALENLVEQDWWEELVAAINAADLNLTTARNLLFSAYQGALYGQWDPNKASTAMYRILVAREKLSGKGGLMEDLGDELGDMFYSMTTSAPYDPFDPAFFKSHSSQLIQTIELVGRKIEEISDLYNCLIRLSGKIRMQKALIIAAEAMLNWLGSGERISVGLDIAIGDNMLWSIISRLDDIRADMKDVVENEKKISAPVHVAMWRGELHSQAQVLQTFCGIPQPWSLPSYASNEQAISDYQYIVYPHKPEDGIRSLSELDFGIAEIQSILGRLISTAGNLSALIVDHEQWAYSLGRVRQDIVQLKFKDEQAVSLLYRFSGYEDQHFDYMMNFLKNAGWSTAEELLGKGFLKDFLALTVEGITSSIVLSQCLASILSDSEVAPEQSQGLQFKLAELQQREQSKALAKMRAASSLPGLQFQAISGLQLHLQKIQSEIDELVDIGERFCG